MGAAYARWVREARLDTPEADEDDEGVARAIERGLAAAMRAAPPLAFGGLAEPALTAAERGWWRAVACAALDAAGLLPRVDFDRFFDLAWHGFARAEAWRVPADVRPALRALRGRGVPLAVFSNWDRRLPPLLGALHLGGFFARIVVSSALAAAKPDAAAYRAAGAALGSGGPAWSGSPIMVGDRTDHDVAPALAAGWDAIWLDRSGRGRTQDGTRRIASLTELPDRLGELGVP